MVTSVNILFVLFGLGGGDGGWFSNYNVNILCVEEGVAATV